MGESEFDVLIVGAGAAGSAAALGLPAGVRGLLIDADIPERGRCCGGLLGPDAQRALQALGLALPPDVRTEPDPKLVRVHDLDAGRTQIYARDYINLLRPRFDSWLVQAAAERVEVRVQTRLQDLCWQEEAWSARLRCHGQDVQVRARMVIGADGAGSRVRKLVAGDAPEPPCLLAMQSRLATENVPFRYEVLFASALTPFYAWAIPKSGHVLVGCAFAAARGARTLFDQVIERMQAILPGPADPVDITARRLTQPTRRAHALAGTAQALLVGEAAGLVSPSSGEGLSFALASGCAAGQAMASPAPAKAYAPPFRALAKRVAWKLLKARIIFTPALRRLALLSPWCP